MPIMDPFSATGFFELADLADAIDRIPYQPGQVGRLGLFQETGLWTHRVRLERRAEQLSVIPVQDRSAPMPAYVQQPRQGISIETFRIAEQTTVTIDALLTVRQFGRDGQAQDVQAWVQQLLADMTIRVDATLEHHMLSALRGYTIDADGSTVIDHFAAFGITPPAEVGLNLSAATEAQLISAINGVVRQIRTALGARTATRILAFCGPTFWDEFTTNPHVRKTYERAMGVAELVNQQGGRLVEGTIRRPQMGFWWQGVYWMEYEGARPAVLEADRALVFPELAGLYRVYYAPPDFATDAGLGRPRYARALPMTPDGRAIPIEVSSYPLALCVEPEVLRRVRSGA